VTHPTRKILYGLAALAILTSSALAAGDGWRIFDVFQRNKAKRIEMLIVTGNYVQSRVLAEVIQYATKQPILLLPTGNEKDIMYFLGPKMEALEIEEADYVQLIDFLQPKKVLFLGNAAYTDPSYIDTLHDLVATWVVNNDDWEQIAFSVEEMLQVRKLAFNYLVLLEQLAERGRDAPKVSISKKYNQAKTIFSSYKTKEAGWSPK